MFMVHRTLVQWALYILFKIVKSLIGHLAPVEMSDMSDDFHEHWTMVNAGGLALLGSNKSCLSLTICLQVIILYV